MPRRPALPPATLPAAEMLFGQGFGVRRACEGLVAGGHLRVDGRLVTDPAAPLPTAGLRFEVEMAPGVWQTWTWQASALVLLHKPAGYECSQKPSAWPGVLLLLPAPLRQRGVQPVGRLDQDTTGVLLLTDDGPLLHRLTAPKHHVPKVYEVVTARPVEPGQIERLRAGVVLDDDPKPVRAAACERTGEQALRLTLTEGRYHQVKRMVAAVGNHCAALHRSAFGPLTLAGRMPGEPPLAPGAWRPVDDDERAALLAAGRAQPQPQTQTPVPPGRTPA